MILGHIAGIPVEEGLPGVVAGGALAAPALYVVARARLDRWRNGSSPASASSSREVSPHAPSSSSVPVRRSNLGSARPT